MTLSPRTRFVYIGFVLVCAVFVRWIDLGTHFGHIDDLGVAKSILAVKDKPLPPDLAPSQKIKFYWDKWTVVPVQWTYAPDARAFYPNDQWFSQSELSHVVWQRNGHSQRNTSPIWHHHGLGTLAPLGFADFLGPLFTETNVPSIKHSLQLNWIFLSSLCMKSSPSHVFSGKISTSLYFIFP